VKGYVRTYVMHQQLLEHLPSPSATVLDVGEARAINRFRWPKRYDVMVLDSSSAMLDKARQRLQQLPDEAQRDGELLQADGENADEAWMATFRRRVVSWRARIPRGNRSFCVDQLCRCAAAGGVVSI